MSRVKETSVLGFQIHLKKLRALERKVTKFKAELKQITRRCPGISMEMRIRTLREYAQGWMAHYGIGMKYNDVVEFDGWIRRRLRMCYWKQWRRTRTKVGKLISLGVPLELAVTAGSSRKGYWRSAKSPGIHMGLSNDWLVNQQLASLRSHWITLHYV